MTEISIRLAGNEDQAQWDRYVERHDDAWPYHLFAWKLAVETAYGFTGRYLVAEKNQDIVGLLPLIKMGIPFGSKKFAALPYCDVGGGLVESNEIRQKLLHHALAIAADEGISRLELHEEPADRVLDSLSLPCRKVTGKARMLLRLPGSAELLWAGFKSKLRSQVRKAEKNGLSFAFSTNVEDFYGVFSENMRDLGSPVHSRSWVESILRFYGEKSRMGLVYYENRPVGAGLILTCGKKVSIPWASTLREFNRLNPNMFLYWNFLQFAADSGFEEFDFGRSTPEEGTYRFKAQWGALPVPLVWTLISLKKEKIAVSGKSDDKRGRDVAATLWSKLPVSAANFFGPKIRKFISL